MQKAGVSIRKYPRMAVVPIPSQEKYFAVRALSPIWLATAAWSPLQPPTYWRAKGVAMQKPSRMTISSMMFTMAALLIPPAEKYKVTTTAAMMMPYSLSIPATTLRIQAIPSSWPENRARS